MSAALPQRLASRYLITVPLLVQSPTRVGAAMGTGSLDLPCLEDGAGRAVLPGTSLAGVLRHELAETVDAEVLERWFGPEQAENGDAGRVFVEDLIVEGAAVGQHHGVGIDRVTRAAAPHYLYNYEVIRPGAETVARIEVECPPNDPKDDKSGSSGTSGTSEKRAKGCVDYDAEARELIGQLLGLFGTGVSIGSGTANGGGRLATGSKPAEVYCQSFEGAEATITSLAGGNKVDIAAEEIASPRVRVSVPLVALGSLMTRADGDVGLTNDLPRVERDAADPKMVRFVIPGSSIKGTLRSHAERIVRTILGSDADGSESDNVPDALNDQIQLDLVSELFGHPARDKRMGEGKDAGAGAVRVETMRSKVSFEEDVWERVRALEPPKNPSEIVGPLATTPAGALGSLRRVISGTPLDKVIRPATHVALDRWTGAPSESALFSTMEVYAAWEPLSVQVNVTRLRRNCGSDRDHDRAHDRADAALYLLMLVIRDLADGFVPLGFAVNRGQGSVELDPDAGITIEYPGGCWPDVVAGAAEGKPVDLDRQLPPSWAKAWADWYGSDNEEAQIDE